MTSPATISTVVLDLGNVLIGWDPRRVWSRTLADPEIETFLAESGFDQMNRSLDGGRAYAEARAELHERAPHHVATLDAYWNDFPGALTGPVPGTEELVAELAHLGLRLIGLTNWSAETVHHAPAAAPAVGMLEDLLVSGREGLLKPDRAIYELLIERFGLVAHETVFVDDTQANVDGARSVGLHAFLFTSAENLRTDLRSLGIDVATSS